MSKNPIAWHEERLKNLNRSVERYELEMQGAIIKHARIDEQRNHLAMQIEVAKKAGKEGFDGEKFMKPKDKHFAEHFRKNIPLKKHPPDVISEQWSYLFESPIEDFFAEFSYFNAPESKALKDAVERLYGDFHLLKAQYCAAHRELKQIHDVGLCIAECPSIKPSDTHTVRMVKEMAGRLNKLTLPMRGVIERSHLTTR